MKIQVLSKSTMRAYEVAARDFEQVTGRRIRDADLQSVEHFQTSMESRKLSASTIRQRLSAVSVLSGVTVELPKRKPTKTYKTLNAQQVRELMSQVKHTTERIVLVQLLTLGPKARTMDAQQASRMIKRYARKAGLNDRQVSLRVWCKSGRQLMEYMAPTELAQLIGNYTDPNPGIDRKPLHGIGRRSKR